MAVSKRILPLGILEKFENNELKVPFTKGEYYLSKQLDAKGYDIDENIARISIIGAGMNSESGVASKMFKTLGDNKINISMISTSPIRVSCVISSNDIEKALNVLHEEFITN